MACFLVPATEAIVTTIAEKAAKAAEAKKREDVAADEEGMQAAEPVVPLSKKLGWLNKMLWGGSALLAFEHIWHGEVVPWYPFLTAMGNTNDAAEMLREMSTVGVGMALSVTAVWGIMIALLGRAVKRDFVAEEPVRVEDDR